MAGKEGKVRQCILVVSDSGKYGRRQGSCPLWGNTSSVFSTGLLFQSLHSTHLPSQQICGYLSFKLILVEKTDLIYITKT